MWAGTMPVRQEDQWRAIKRGLDRSLDILLNSKFQDGIASLRRQFGIDVGLMRQRAKERLVTTQSPDSEEGLARIKVLLDFMDEKRLWTRKHGQQVQRVVRRLFKEGIILEFRHVIAGLCFEPIGLAKTKLQVDQPSADDIVAQLFTDKACYHEFMSFSVFCELQAEVLDRVFYYDSTESDETFESWREIIATTLLPNHIYVDITGLNIDKIQLLWITIAGIKERLGDVSELRRGRPKGAPSPRKEVVRRMTWPEVREYVASNPRELYRLENDYIAECIAKRKLKNLGWDNRLVAHWRGLAIQNFYKQTIVHPAMRDLNLQIRKRGRPRKHNS